jgi:hypothetical protein
MNITVRYRNRSSPTTYDPSKPLEWNIGVAICALQLATGFSIFAL